MWINFEVSDPNFSIWTGCFWGESQTPAQPAVPMTFVFKTTFATLSIKDLTAEIVLQVPTPPGLQTVNKNPEGTRLSSNAVSVTIAQEAIKIETGAASIGLKNRAASTDLSPTKVSLINALERSSQTG